MHQKMEFLEVQLHEARNQSNEVKRAYEAALACFDGSNQSSSAEDMRQIEDLKENHRMEIRQIETEFESSRKRLTQQLELLTEKNSELERNANFSASDMKKEIESLKEELEQSEHQKKILSNQNKALESQKLRIYQEAEERYAQRIRSLESELEDQKSKMEQDLYEINTKNEESLSQLRNFYEMEKERLERRITEEKDKTEKKLTNLSEEYETRIKEDQALHEEEMDSLKDELRDVEIQSSSIAQQYEQELMLRQQNIETLEKYLKEAKDTINTMQVTHTATIENHLNNFTVERSQLISRLENSNQEIAKKDREIFSLTQNKEHLETSSTKKAAMLDKIKRELSEEKITLSEALEATKIK